MISISIISDILSNPPNNFSTTLSGNVSSSGLTLALNDVTGLGTEGVGVIYQKDSDGNPVTSTIEFVHWTGVSSLNLTLTDTGDRGINGSASGAQAHNSGDTFEVWTHSAYYPLNAVTLSAAQTLTNKTLTQPKINEDVAVTATATEINLLDGKTALGAFWTSFAGAYATGTTITVSGTDVTGIFKKGVVLKWQKADNTFKTGMVVSSSYSAPDTTITIIGSTVESGDKNFYYGGDALIETFIIPGTLGAATDIAKTWYCPTACYPIGCDGHVKTAGTTNPTEFDINDDGTSLFNGTACSIASGATSDLANVAYTPTTVIVADSIITVDINSVSTTPPVEAYLQLYYYPQWWVNRT